MAKKKPAKKKAAKRPAKKAAKRPAKKNPAIRYKRVTGAGTGWQAATAVKIVRRRGHPDQVLVRKPAKRRKKK